MPVSASCFNLVCLNRFHLLVNFNRHIEHSCDSLFSLWFIFKWLKYSFWVQNSLLQNVHVLLPKSKACFSKSFFEGEIFPAVMTIELGMLFLKMLLQMFLCANNLWANAAWLLHNFTVPLIVEFLEEDLRALFTLIFHHMDPFIMDKTYMIH